MGNVIFLWFLCVLLRTCRECRMTQKLRTSISTHLFFQALDLFPLCTWHVVLDTLGQQVTVDIDKQNRKAQCQNLARFKPAFRDKGPSVLQARTRGTCQGAVALDPTRSDQLTENTARSPSEACISLRQRVAERHNTSTNLFVKCNMFVLLCFSSEKVTQSFFILQNYLSLRR